MPKVTHLTKQWFVYCIPPIDNFWDMLKTVDETSALLQSYAEEDQGHREVASTFEADFASAKYLASEYLWEEDFRHEPCVFRVPDELEFVYGFVWKQDNNGTCFVVSPVALPHLEKLEM